MDMVCREEIVEPPNPRRELRLGEDPSAAQAAQSVGLSEAAGDDELASEVERRWDGRVMEGFQIDLIDEDARSNFVRQFSDRAQALLAGESAGGIVQVAEHDQARLRGQVSRYFFRIECILVLDAALKTAHGRAEVKSSAQDRIVSRLFNKHLLSGRE